MAKSASIHRASVNLSNVDRNHYAQFSTTLARHPSETAERMVGRLIAYALSYEEGMTFGRGVSHVEEADVWVKTPDDRVSLWVEVGLPDPERLVKASRHSERVVLYAFGPTLRRWVDQNMDRLQQLENLSVYGLDFDFIKTLAQLTERNMDWVLTLMEGRIFLCTGDRTLEADLLNLQG